MKTIVDDDLMRKMRDREWRLRNLYYITNKQKKKIKFKMNKAQLELFRSSEKLEATLKARQLGISTYYIIKYLDTCLFAKNRTVCILAHEQDAVKKLFRIAKYAYDNMHPEIRPRIHKGGGSAYEMYFPEINSRIYCDLESRGDTISDLHISEAAFSKDREKILATVDAVPVDTGNISYETTANGLNHFHRDWVNPDWPYRKFFFPWFFTRGYTYATAPIVKFSDEEIKLKEMAYKRYNISLSDQEIAFRRFKIAQKGKSHFLQEFPEDEMSCFLMSGNPVMDKFNVAALISKLVPPIEDRRGLKIFEKPIAGAEYVIGADVAEGVGSDYSVACVINRDTLEQVASFRAHIKPFDFADKIMEIAEYYSNENKPRIAVERNNHGHAVVGKLEEAKYPNLYYAPDKRAGWLTTKVTRPLMLDTFIEGVETGSVTLRDVETLNECLTLIDNNGKIEHEKGCHDDCVIATSIALKVCLDKPKERNIRITGF